MGNKQKIKSFLAAFKYIDASSDVSAKKGPAAFEKQTLDLMNHVPTFVCPLGLCECERYIYSVYGLM